MCVRLGVSLCLSDVCLYECISVYGRLSVREERKRPQEVMLSLYEEHSQSITLHVDIIRVKQE